MKDMPLTSHCSTYKFMVIVLLMQTQIQAIIVFSEWENASIFVNAVFGSC